METLSQDALVAKPDTLDNLPIDADIMFADHKGARKPRIEKKQRKLLQKIGFLKPFLEDGEKLLLTTTAVSPTSFLEQWTTGVAFVYIKRCFLVFTDRRIIHVPTTMGYAWRQSIAEIRYTDIESVDQSGSKMKLGYKSGAKEKFLYIRGSERKKTRELLRTVNFVGEPTAARERVHLCPSCKSHLNKDEFTCPGCQFEFKGRKKARMLSMLLPGGGYFYTGHPFFGIADAFFEALLIVGIVFMLVPSAQYPEPQVGAAIFLGVLLVLEKAITVYHANHFVKEYLPVHPEKRKTSAGQLILKTVGIAAILGVVGLMFLGIMMELGQAPSDRVLAQGDIPEQHYEVLAAEGMLYDGEVIEFFYSEGLTSIRDGGSILTNYRVMAYGQDEDGQINFFQIPNEAIASVELKQQGDTFNYSVYVVHARDDEGWIELWLPHEYGDAERFVAAVKAKIVP